MGCVFSIQKKQTLDKLQKPPYNAIKSTISTLQCNKWLQSVNARNSINNELKIQRKEVVAVIINYRMSPYDFFSKMNRDDLKDIFSLEVERLRSSFDSFRNNANKHVGCIELATSTITAHAYLINLEKFNDNEFSKIFFEYIKCKSFKKEVVEQSPKLANYINWNNLTHMELNDLQNFLSKIFELCNSVKNNLYDNDIAQQMLDVTCLLYSSVQWFLISNKNINSSLKKELEFWGGLAFLLRATMPEELISPKFRIGSQFKDNRLLAIQQTIYIKNS